MVWTIEVSFVVILDVSSAEVVLFVMVLVGKVEAVLLSKMVIVESDIKYFVDVDLVVECVSEVVVDIDGENRTLLAFKKDLGKNMRTEIKSFDLGDEKQLERELNEKFEGKKCNKFP